MKRALTSLFVLFFLVTGFCGCTQKYGIIKSHAYVRETTAGNIPVDQNNNPTTPGVRKNHIIYVETDSSRRPIPEWETAWVEGVSYSIEPIAVKNAEVNLGALKNEVQEVVVKAKEGNELWQLMLTKKNGIEPDPILKEMIEKNKIVITGHWKGTPFSYKISEEKQLAKVFGE
jgi:hypothetical protein